MLTLMMTILYRLLLKFDIENFTSSVAMDWFWTLYPDRPSIDKESNIPCYGNRRALDDKFERNQSH